MYEELEDKNVLITGASGGLGSCIAKEFGKYKCRVGIHFNTNIEKAIAASLEIDNEKAELFKANLLYVDAAIDLVDNFVVRFKGIDVLINNAGGVHPVTEEVTQEIWDNMINLNIRAPFFLSQQAFKHMLNNEDGGRIINIGSISSKYGGSSQTMPYAVAKAGLEPMTRRLAIEGAIHDILVNTVRVGVINTPLHKKIGRGDKWKSDRVKKIPLGRLGTPKEVADMVVFLASNGGNYITGEVITIAGGE